MMKGVDDTVPIKEEGLDAKQTLVQFENLVSAASIHQPTYIFRLFISGSTQRSAAAISGVRRICEQYLSNHYGLEIIDVYQQPSAAKSAEVIAIPTLIKEWPLPSQRFIGDMSKVADLEALLKLRG